MTKHIFITGGVVSSLGKGVTSASVGMLLESRGIAVRMQKLDPYLNIDPGTMSPYQHGEVYVLDDGSETDLDMGHYERFTEGPLSRDSNLTTGRIYQAVLQREERNEYNGETIQVIPHITDEIKKHILRFDSPDVDVVITEIGGTTGDIESLPFLEAIRQIPLDIGRNNCLFVHLTLVPRLTAADELKTKPTQRTVESLRQIGIQPDMIVCRTEVPLPEEIIKKIAFYCNTAKDCVIEERDADLSVYEVPMTLAAKKVDEKIIRLLNLEEKVIPDLSPWQQFLDHLRYPKQKITIAVVGKYAKHKDAYKSVYEAIVHADAKSEVYSEVLRIQSEHLNRPEIQERLKTVDGILLPGGFGERGVEGIIDAVRIARENGIPFLGICLGMQCAVIEFARHVLGMTDANSREFDQETRHPVICLMDSQKKVVKLGGTMRLGIHRARLKEGSNAANAYGSLIIEERHRHRYEFNSDFKDDFIKGGLDLTGTSPDGKLVEVVELRDHPWFTAAQYHPEFTSRPTAPNPLFRDFIAAALKYHLNKK